MKIVRSSACNGGHKGVLRTGLLLLVGIVCIADDLPAQRTVMVYQEPRHRLVVDHGEIKLLDVQILPGDTTLDHTHDSPILYTYINLGNGSLNGRVMSNVYEADDPYTHRVPNNGTELFRIIALAHYGEGKQDQTDLPQGFSDEPGFESQWFRSYRLELAPGQETAVHTHQNPAVVVQVTDGRVEVTKENGFGAELSGEGHWTWRDAGSPYQIRNVGSEVVFVVVNEAR
jgi:quercetin dioxygenase-like cupin family protein